ncbi:MAG: hypothetical protein GXO86_03380, partial [Chlorobi bacterium]|nr:hypothetical protein [Chlorobiota bacterium]
NITHLQYKEVVKNPMKALHRIYADRNETISSELEKIFTEADKNNGQGKYGKHIYSLEDFGIDEKFIDKYTKEYQVFQKKLNAK